MKRKRYLFFDIDGTLLAGGYGNSYIPDSTVLALQKCREAGHFLCIATGRLQAMAVDCMHELGFTSMVSDGGYGITIDDKFYGATPLPKDLVIRLVDECAAKGMPWALQVDNTVYRSAPDSRFPILVIPTNEELQIAESAVDVVSSERSLGIGTGQLLNLR